MTLTSDAPLRTSAERPLKQVHLAAHFPGVNNTTVWRDNSNAASQIAFSSFTHFAHNAEKGKFDFLFLAETWFVGHVKYVRDRRFVSSTPLPSPSLQRTRNGGGLYLLASASARGTARTASSR